jgi:hypothetical protein
MKVGSDADLRVSRKFTNKLPKPYSNCNFQSEKDKKKIDPELLKIIRIKNITYSFQFCISLCYQKHIVDICKCYDSESEPYEPYEVCHTKKDLECVRKTYESFSSYGSTINSECYNLCPIECETSEYMVSISISKYPPSVHYINLLKNNPKIIKLNPDITDFELMWESVLKLNVFYESLSYTIISESPAINLYSLGANLGGTIGLFLGKRVLIFSNHLFVI